MAQRQILSPAKLIHLLIEERAKVLHLLDRERLIAAGNRPGDIPGELHRDQARREIEAEVLTANRKGLKK